MNQFSIQRMQTLCVLTLCLGFLPGRASGEDQSQQNAQREQNITALVKAVGIESTIVQVEKDNREDARKAVDSVLEQFKDFISRLPGGRGQELRAAVDRFLATATEPIGTADAAAAWGHFFAANLSDEDLQAIVDFSRTRLGTTELKSSTSAAAQWATYLREKHQVNVQKAVQQYVADLKALAAEIHQPAAPLTPSTSEKP